MRCGRGLVVVLALMVGACAGGSTGERLDEGSGGTAASNGLERYLAFIQRERAALKQERVSEAEREHGEAALRELLGWLHGKGEARLRREAPEELYWRFKAEHAAKAHEDAARAEAVEARLMEYVDWAQARSRQMAAVHFRKAGKEWLLTESPLYEEAQQALSTAVVRWGFEHREEGDFLRRSPSEVAVYLLARRSALATAVEAGLGAAPRLDFVGKVKEEVDPAEVVLEVAVGLVPGVGEVADVEGALVGYGVLGRELSGEERLLCAVGVLVPLVSGRALGEAERLALRTGHGVKEMQVLQRVAQHLAPEEVERVRGLLRAAGRGERISAEELEALRALARRLERPLVEAGKVLRAGGRVPLVGSRVTAEGARLVPGSAEHLAQAWVDYQFRHPGKYPRIRYEVEAEWEGMYRRVLENKGAGSEFEQQVLKRAGKDKNRAMMLPPPGSKGQGFLPDAVVGNAEELVWGEPYHFVEAKGRADMALTGNLEAMIRYVTKHGGHIEVWFRSARHASGATRLTGPLERALNLLAQQGQATVRHYP